MIILPKTLSKKCIEEFENEFTDLIPYWKNNNIYYYKKKNEIAFSSTKKINDIYASSEKYFCILYKTTDDNFHIDKDNKNKYLQYLISFHLKDKPLFCIEKTIRYLIATLLMILIFAICIDFANQPHKKIIFFSISTVIFLSVNYKLIKSFYTSLITGEQKSENITTYIKVNNSRHFPKINKREELIYKLNKLDFGKIYPVYMAIYFGLIITFSFYCASLLHTQG